MKYNTTLRKLSACKLRTSQKKNCNCLKKIIVKVSKDLNCECLKMCFLSDHCHQLGIADIQIDSIQCLNYAKTTTYCH